MAEVPPFQPYSATSRAAALDAATRTPGQRERILDYVRSRGADGATRREISDALGIEIGTVCGRVKPMLAAGELSVIGTREGPYGIENEIVAAFVTEANGQLSMFSHETRRRETYH